jgi:hypothetical protein
MGKFISMQQKFARGMTERQMSVMTDRKHFDRSKKERPHSGTLWKADKSGGDIHGGWKNGSSWKKPASVAGIAAPAAVGLYFILRNRRSSQLRAAA